MAPHTAAAADPDISTLSLHEGDNSAALTALQPGSTTRTVSGWAALQHGLGTWGRLLPRADASARLRRRPGQGPRRALPGMTWLRDPAHDGGEAATAAEFQDGDELERAGKGEGQLAAAALAALAQKPYDPEVHRMPLLCYPV